MKEVCTKLAPQKRHTTHSQFPLSHSLSLPYLPLSLAQQLLEQQQQEQLRQPATHAAMSSSLNVSVSAKKLATSRPAVAIRVALPSPLSPLSLSPLSLSWHLSASATATASLFCVPQHDDYTKLNASCIRIACHCMRARASACVCVCQFEC